MPRYIFALSLLLILSSCDKPLKKVRVGITPFFGEAAFYVAREKNFFEDNGLDIVTLSHSAGKKSLKELYSGNLDIAHTAELPLVYALLGSADYQGDISPRILANMIYNTGMQKIVARRDRAIEQPADLKDKRIGYFKGTTSEFFLDTFLLEHNIADSSIKKVDIDVAKQYEALRSGTVDAVASWEPYASKMLEELEDTTFELQTRIDHSTLWLIVSTDTYISSKPEVIRSYLIALRQAQLYIKNYPRETQRLLADKTETSIHTISRLWSNIDYELSLGEYSMLLMEDQKRWLRQKGYVENQTKELNFEEHIHFKALEEVYPDGITAIR